MEVFGSAKDDWFTGSKRYNAIERWRIHPGEVRGTQGTNRKTRIATLYYVNFSFP